MLTFEQLFDTLEKYYQIYHTPDFVENDPIQIPKAFSKKKDIEISGFFASIFAWGKRKIIIDKSRLLCELMDNAPHDFILYHTSKDIEKFKNFCHRTFNFEDLRYFFLFLQKHYQKNESLENAFSDYMREEDINIENALRGFYDYFCDSEEFLPRTRKHISTPARKSACKRLSMFLRWMVRTDNQDIDFGIWQKIKPSQLICPYDIHVERNATKLGLVKDNKANWANAVFLTENLKKFDKNDPVKYDFALFGMGVGK